MPIITKIYHAVDTFGYHSAQSIAGTAWGDVAGQHSTAHILPNALNGGGYIPIVGIATGILRCMAVLRVEEWKGNKGVQATQIARGCLEIMGCGSLFLIPDLIVSIGRLKNSNSTRGSGIRSSWDCP